MSNRWLVGIVGSLLVVSFAFGRGYSALASDAVVVKARVDKMEVEQKQLATHVATIQLDVGIVKNDIEHIKNRLDDVLRILEGR